MAWKREEMMKSHVEPTNADRLHYDSDPKALAWAHLPLNPDDNHPRSPFMVQANEAYRRAAGEWGFDHQRDAFLEGYRSGWVAHSDALASVGRTEPEAAASPAEGADHGAQPRMRWSRAQKPIDVPNDWDPPSAALVAPSPVSSDEASVGRTEPEGVGILNCPVCGSGKEGDCICPAAEAIAKAEWERSGRAVYEAPWEQVSDLKRHSLIVKALPAAHKAGRTEPSPEAGGE